MGAPTTRRKTATALLVGFMLLASPVLPVGAIDGQPDYLAVLQACPGGQTNTSVPHATGCLESLEIAIGNAVAAFTVGVPVRRWAMAHALINAAWAAGVTLPEPKDQGFQDIDGLATGTQRSINQLAELGITRGKTAHAFDPGGMVTRQQMAVFFTRLLALAATGPGGRPVSDVVPDDTVFTDIGDLSAQAQQAIRVIYELGVTTGTTATTFSPSEPVTGGQMALFLTRLLAHTTARGEGGFKHIRNTPNRLAYHASWCYDSYFSSPEFCEDGITISNSDGSNKLQITKDSSNSIGDLIWSPNGQHIVYSSYDNTKEKYFLYAVGIDGSNPLYFGEGLYPVWSPDSKYISYNVYVGDRKELWVASLDGTVFHRLTRGSDYVYGPQWSPSSLYIAYIVEIDGGRIFNGRSELWVAKADGSASIRLSTDVLFSRYMWSMGANVLAYQTWVDDVYEVWLTSVDDSNSYRLTKNGVLGDFTPDGRNLLYASDDGSAQKGIWKINIDRLESERITTEVASLPRWSPDGQSITYAVWVDDEDFEYGRKEIGVVDVDGSNPRRLAQDIGSPDKPKWSPDGKYIAYQLNLAGEIVELWVVGADGSNPRLLAPDIYWDDFEWLADSKYIIYETGIGDVNEGLWVVGVDGEYSRPRRLSLYGPYDISPNGDLIAYTVYDGEGRSRNSIWVANADGTNQRRVGYGWQASWQP